MDRQGQGMSIELVIKITLGLIVLVILVFLVYRAVKDGNENLKACPGHCVGTAQSTILDGSGGAQCASGEDHYPIGDIYCKQKKQGVLCCA